MLLIFLGFLGIIYDILLICMNPGTFLDNLTTFSHIWSVLGGLLIFTGIFRRRTGRWPCSRWKKGLKITAISVLGAGFLISLICLLFIWTPRTVSMSENCDYVILLGGGIDKNGRLPQTVRRRVELAAEYLEMHEDTLCVVTGGTLKWLPYAEAPEIRNQLIASGIKSERILVEDKALDTIQNLSLTCRLLAEYEGVSEREILDRSFIIITSRFHLRRAEQLAKRMGFENVQGIGSKCGIILLAQCYVREIGAYVKLSLRILLTKKPERIA